MADVRGETSVIEHRLRIAAAPETVFAYFTDPAKIVQWMGTEATLDPQPGGVCRIRLNDVSVMVGEYVTVEPYRRITFTWGYEQQWFAMPPQSTLVEVSLTPDGDGTVVVLSHKRLPTSVSIASTRAGWTHYLPRLDVTARGGDPGPDSWQDVDVVLRDIDEMVERLA